MNKYPHNFVKKILLVSLFLVFIVGTLSVFAQGGDMIIGPDGVSRPVGNPTGGDTTPTPGGRATGNPSANDPLPEYTPLAPLPCIPDGKTVTKEDCDKSNSNPLGKINFKDYVQRTFNIIIALAAAAAVFMTVWGGLQYMTTDSWEGKNEGLLKARNALLGLLLILCSFILLRTIDPRLVAIPTTLVKPLDIKYESNIGGLLESLSGNINRLNPRLLDSAQMQEGIKSAVTQMADAATRELAATQQLCSVLGKTSCTDKEITNLCVDSMDEPSVQRFCDDRDNAINQSNVIQADLYVKGAQVLISTEVSECFLANGLTRSQIQDRSLECSARIDLRVDELRGYIYEYDGSRLVDIDDYAAYAEAILKMQAAVLTYNPGTASTLGSVKNVITGASILAGPVGIGVGGLVRGTISLLTPDSASAAGTLSEIQSITDHYSSLIQNQNLKDWLTAYENTLRGGLGE